MTVPAQEALPGLHDVVVPEPVGWMPETVGWLGVLVVVITLSAWGLVRRHRTKVANRYRVAALEELDAIESALGVPARRVEALSALPVLLKRVALSFAERERVAGLTGEAWLAFLDEAYGGSGFTSGPGRVVSELAYASPHAMDAVEAAGTSDLVVLVSTWIRTHDPRRVTVGPSRA